MSADAYAVKIVADGFARGRETSFVDAEKPLTVAAELSQSDWDPGGSSALTSREQNGTGKCTGGPGALGSPCRGCRPRSKRSHRLYPASSSPLIMPWKLACPADAHSASYVATMGATQPLHPEQ